MDVASFRARFPEFRAALDGTVQAVIDEATASIDATVFGSRFEAAVGYLAAHLLAVSPMGKNQRLEDDKSETTYWKDYSDIRRAVVIRVFVT